jgi:superfamily II DNA helicase RecQ
MSRRITRTSVHLYPAKTKDLPIQEVKAILRGADDLIARGGRTLLSKILKGSKEKKILELGLDRSPAYGFFQGFSTEHVLEKIDWLIKNYYLQYEYDGRLPLLVYTPKGWEIERGTYAEELFQKLRAMVEGNESTFDVATLKDRNRGMIMLLLDILETQADERFIPLLQRWYDLEYKKVRQRIGSVIRAIKAVPAPRESGRTVSS